MRSLYAKVNEIGLPKTIEELKQLHHFEFQNWVFDKLHGRVNPRKVGDFGVDGWVELNIPTQGYFIFVSNSITLSRFTLYSCGYIFERIY